MADPKGEAQNAIFEGITRVAGELEAKHAYQPQNAAEVLVRLALAYRHAAGGPQPGSPTTEPQP